MWLCIGNSVHLRVAHALNYVAIYRALLTYAAINKALWTYVAIYRALLTSVAIHRALLTYVATDWSTPICPCCVCVSFPVQMCGDIFLEPYTETAALSCLSSVQSVAT